MKTLILILLLPLCSYGQSVPKGATTLELKPSIGQYLSESNDNNILWNPNQSDTVAVYMLVTYKVNTDKPVLLMQWQGYSVTPRIFYNSLPFSTYLDNNKKPYPPCVLLSQGYNPPPDSLSVLTSL